MGEFLIAVLADTHVPDRIPALSPAFLEALKEVQPDLIVHAGDISTKSVLEALEEIAPVIAVRGSRDFFLRKNVPKVMRFEQNGIRFAVMHGHIDFFTYWMDKFLYVLQGYRRERYLTRLPKVVSDAQVYIYGHTHHAENVEKEGILFFNPGSVSFGDFPDFKRSWGTIRIHVDGSVEGNIIALD